jgi:hypothetical protein
LQCPPNAAAIYHRQLHIGNLSSETISRGFLFDLTFRGTPPTAMPCVGRILAHSKIVSNPIDLDGLETHLHCWHLEGDGVKSLKRDWVVVLSLIPHELELMPGEVTRAFEFEMAKAKARVGKKIWTLVANLSAK